MSLLVDWLFYPPAGHVIEGLKFAKGCVDADPTLDVHILFTRSGASGVAARVPWATVHEIDILPRQRFRAPLRHLPDAWDVIVHNPMGETLAHGQDWPGLLRATADTRALTARLGHFVAPVFEDLRTHEPLPIPYLPSRSVRLTPLSQELDWVQARLSTPGPHICVLPAGSTVGQSPTVDAWALILDRLRLEHPTATVHFTGRSAATAGYSESSMRTLAERYEKTFLWWDAPIERQLALFACCDLLVSPHTGFAFLASAVGTPWLTLSGCQWPEYLFNGVPFHSVLPDCAAYPSLADRPSSPCTCMATSSIASKLTEIAAAAGRLLAAEPYADALARHLARVSTHPRAERFFFFDGRDALSVVPPQAV